MEGYVEKQDLSRMRMWFVWLAYLLCDKSVRCQIFMRSHEYALVIYTYTYMYLFTYMWVPAALDPPKFFYC